MAVRAQHASRNIRGSPSEGGAECEVDEEVSLYYIANEITTTSHGMMIAIPEPEWDMFYAMSPAD